MVIPLSTGGAITSRCDIGREDPVLQAAGGAVQALYDMESFYGLYPTVVDGQIHFVFRDSVSMETSLDDYDLANASAGAKAKAQEKNQ